MRQPIKFEQEVLSKYGISWIIEDDDGFYSSGHCGCWEEGSYVPVSPEEIHGIAIKEAFLLTRDFTIVFNRRQQIQIECGFNGLIQGDTYEKAINALIREIWGD